MNHYPGGKGGVFQRLINLMPPHEVYIETHLGGDAVMRNKRPAERNIGLERQAILTAINNSNRTKTENNTVHRL